MTPADALAEYAAADKRRTATQRAVVSAERALDLARFAFQRADQDRTDAVHFANDAYRMAEHEAGRPVDLNTKATLQPTEESPS